MATPVSIRPSIGRIINAAKVFPGAKTTLGPVLPTASCQKCPFSATPEYNNRRPRRDNNRFRGMSSLYRSGLRHRTNIDPSELPKPVNFKSKLVVDPNHGLWEFFYAKNKLLLTPEEAAEHGRGWTVEELRHKSWEDLHKLWWVCAKEKNRLSTLRKERSRLQLPGGAEEEAERMQEVRRTMKALKHALTERWYAWEDARKLAETDPEVDLNNRETPFTPKDQLENYEAATEAAEAEQSNFMAEEPSTTKPEDVDPSTIPAQTQTQAPETPVAAKP